MAKKQIKVNSFIHLGIRRIAAFHNERMEDTAERIFEKSVKLELLKLKIPLPTANDNK